MELECVKKALFIIQNDGVRWLPDYHVHGWVLVTSQHHIESNNMNVQPPLFDPISQRDHDYDLKAKPRNFLADLDLTASIAWRSELESHLPLQNVKIPVYQHICNLYLGICSCRSFLKKGQPYFCKHLYAIHADLRQLNSPVQIVEYCQYITPSLTSYLAEIYQIKHLSPLISHSELDLVKNLISQSHEATAEELQLAKQGKLLQKINQTQHSDIKKIVFLGTPAKRAPHNGGKRRVGGPIKESNYSLTEQDFTTNDPYSPKVDFPSSAQERHCGRKRTRTATRGVSMSKLKDHAINALNTKLNNDDNVEPKKKRRRLGTEN